MQPWFTKIFFLWQVKKNVLNNPQKTLFKFHGSLSKILYARKFFRVYLYGILAAESESVVKKDPKCTLVQKKFHFFKKCPISTRNTLLIQFPAVFYCGAIFPEHYEPLNIQIGS